eukprot:g3338.t1
MSSLSSSVQKDDNSSTKKEKSCKDKENGSVEDRAQTPTALRCARALKCLDILKWSLHPTQQFRRLIVEAVAAGEWMHAPEPPKKETNGDRDDFLAEVNHQSFPSCSVYSSPRCVRTSERINFDEFEFEGDVREFILTGLSAPAQKWLYQRVEAMAGPNCAPNLQQRQQMVRGTSNAYNDPSGVRVPIWLTSDLSTRLPPQMPIIVRRGPSICTDDKDAWTVDTTVIAGVRYTVVGVSERNVDGLLGEEKKKKKKGKNKKNKKNKKKKGNTHTSTSSVVILKSSKEGAETFIPVRKWNDLMEAGRIDGAAGMTPACFWASYQPRMVIPAPYFEKSGDPDRLRLFILLSHVQELKKNHIALPPGDANLTENLREILNASSSKTGQDLSLAANVLLVILENDGRKQPYMTISQMMIENFVIKALDGDVYPIENIERIFGVEMGGANADFEAVGQAVYRCWISNIAEGKPNVAEQ